MFLQTSQSFPSNNGINSFATFLVTAPFLRLANHSAHNSLAFGYCDHPEFGLLYPGQTRLCIQALPISSSGVDLDEMLVWHQCF